VRDKRGLMVDVAKLAAKYDPAEALRQLASADPAVRLAGAKWIEKQARGEANRFTAPWLEAAGTLDRLLPLLEDPDARVVEQAIGAVNMIAARYRRDDRAIVPALRLLASKRPQTRIRAALLLTQFDDERLAEPLLALFADPDKAVRYAVVSELARPARTWPAATQEKVRRAALARLQDRTVDVRCAAAGLLISVGQAEDIPALRAAYKSIQGVNWRQEFRESLAMLEARWRGV
jgi:HEAT repeat protein